VGRRVFSKGGKSLRKTQKLVGGKIDPIVMKKKKKILALAPGMGLLGERRLDGGGEKERFAPWGKA